MNLLYKKFVKTGLDRPFRLRRIVCSRPTSRRNIRSVGRGRQSSGEKTMTVGSGLREKCPPLGGGRGDFGRVDLPHAHPIRNAKPFQTGATDRRKGEAPGGAYGNSSVGGDRGCLWGGANSGKRWGRDKGPPRKFQGGVIT